MAYRKKTLRRMSPTARKVARLAGELDSVTRRLKNLVPELQQLDLDSKALAHAKEPAARAEAATLAREEGFPSVAEMLELGEKS